MKKILVVHYVYLIEFIYIYIYIVFCRKEKLDEKKFYFSSFTINALLACNPSLCMKILNNSNN